MVDDSPQRVAKPAPQASASCVGEIQHGQGTAVGLSEPGSVDGAPSFERGADAGVAAGEGVRDALYGRVLGGRYQLRGRLAEGGMGRVYLATQMALGRHVAVKLLRASLHEPADTDFHRRFFAEAQTAARLQHPHSVTVLDYGCEDDGTYYLVMEYLRGQSLAQMLRHGGAFAPVRALALALQVGRAVQAAHALGIVHRDLKPDNLMVLQWGEDAARQRDDFVKVLDFGLAKQLDADAQVITRTGKFLGSPGYMAPEQILGQKLDGRCDVYALGAVVYEMLCGRPPFRGDSPHETMRAHVGEVLPPLWPPGAAQCTALAHAVGEGAAARAGAAAGMHAQQQALEALVRRAMAKAPDARFANMGEMLAALHAVHGALRAAQADGQVRAGEALAAAALRAGQESTRLMRDGVPVTDCVEQAADTQVALCDAAAGAQLAACDEAAGTQVDAGEAATVLVDARTQLAAPPTPQPMEDDGTRLADGTWEVPPVQAPQPRDAVQACHSGEPTHMLNVGALPSVQAQAPTAALEQTRFYDAASHAPVTAVALADGVARLQDDGPAARRARQPRRTLWRAANRLGGQLMTGALVLLAGGWFATSGRGHAAMTQSALPVETTPFSFLFAWGKAAAESVPQPEVPAAPPVAALVEMDSRPRGAGVYLNGECICLATPCALQLPACEVGTRLQFRFALPNYDDFLLSKTVPPAAPGANVVKVQTYARLQ